MNEELLNQALEGVLSTMSETKGFVLEQAPEVIQQLLLYKTIGCAAGVVLTLLPIVASYFWIKKAFLEYEKNLSDQNVYIIMAGIIFGCLLTPLSVLCLCVCSMNLIKITIAPKIYILEYVAGLVG